MKFQALIAYGIAAAISFAPHPAAADQEDRSPEHGTPVPAGDDSALVFGDPLYPAPTPVVPPERDVAW
ncbi:MAG: hypothetical protein ABI624_01265 [Casimicrobiaceae bacterium]